MLCMLAASRKPGQVLNGIDPMPKTLRTSNLPFRLWIHEPEILWREQNEWKRGA